MILSSLSTLAASKPSGQFSDLQAQLFDLLLEHLDKIKIVESLTKEIQEFMSWKTSLHLLVDQANSQVSLPQEKKEEITTLD